LANGELATVTLRSDERLSYLGAVDALRPTGVDLMVAARQFSEAHQLLRGAPLLDAVRFYIEHRPQTCSKSVAEIAAELLQQKKDMGRCEDYLKDIRLRLKRFSDAFRCSISSISPPQIEEFLIRLKVSAQTQNNFRRLVGTLIRFAIKRGYLPKDHPGVTTIEVATEIPGDVQIFNCEEMAKLLAAAEPEVVPFLALGGFAGLRHAEIKRLDWSDIHLQDGHIELKARQAKTRIRRLIPLHENLRRWLQPHVKENGAVVPYANMSKQLMWLAEEAGVPWKHNALRHSYVSYRTAETQNIPQVSYESGNSVRIIERNYLKRVTISEAQRWFSISPAGETKILQFPVAAAT
jgi:integrase